MTSMAYYDSIVFAFASPFFTIKATFKKEKRVAALKQQQQQQPHHEHLAANSGCSSF
jgi:hypothetical protein